MIDGRPDARTEDAMETIPMAVVRAMETRRRRGDDGGGRPRRWRARGDAEGGARDGRARGVDGAKGARGRRG